MAYDAEVVQQHDVAARAVAVDVAEERGQGDGFGNRDRRGQRFFAVDEGVRGESVVEDRQRGPGIRDHRDRSSDGGGARVPFIRQQGRGRRTVQQTERQDVGRRGGPKVFRVGRRGQVGQTELNRVVRHVVGANADLDEGLLAGDELERLGAVDRRSFGGGGVGEGQDAVGADRGGRVDRDRRSAVDDRASPAPRGVGDGTVGDGGGDHEAVEIVVKHVELGGGHHAHTVAVRITGLVGASAVDDGSGKSSRHVSHLH